MITIRNTGRPHANGYKVLEVYEGQTLIANNCDVVRIGYDITIDADDNGLRGWEAVATRTTADSITLSDNYVMLSKYFNHTCELQPIAYTLQAWAKKPRTLGFETLAGNFFVSQALPMADVKGDIRPRIIRGFFTPTGELVRLSSKTEARYLHRLIGEEIPQFKVFKADTCFFDAWAQPALHLFDDSGDRDDEVLVSFKELREAPEGTRYCAQAWNGREDYEDIFIVGVKTPKGVQGLRNGKPCFIKCPR